MGGFVTIFYVLIVLSMLFQAVRIFLRQGLIAKLAGMWIFGLAIYMSYLGLGIIPTLLAYT